MEREKNIAMVINGEFPTNSRIIDKIRSAEKVIAVDGATNTLIDQGPGQLKYLLRHLLQSLFQLI